MAKMSDGDVDVEPYLNIRNTKGYGAATQILKLQSGNTCRSAKRSKLWWYVEVGIMYSGRSAFAEMWVGGGD